jgi:hypothetical protein
MDGSTAQCGNPGWKCGKSKRNGLNPGTTKTVVTVFFEGCQGSHSQF